MIQDRVVQPNAEFKTHAIKAILAIVLFILTYVTLLGWTIWLTMWCIWLAYKILAFHTSGFTILIGLGLGSFALLILIFLLKFIFTSSKTDFTGMVEVHAAHHPELFQMIDELVRTVGTNFPKKVYLSNEVNAAVIYDSNFWSMFLPIPKNLIIGVGLVNTLTREELKSVLAHEFGHFSQRTMKVGSYMYQVNRIIYNMLFENSGYETFVENWGSINSMMYVFIMAAIKLVQAIQWILKKLYIIVNKSYMALSREMEFHADEIAASVTGFEPLRNALLRMPMANSCFTYVLNTYSDKIGENIVSKNIFADQLAILHQISQRRQYPVANGLPLIGLSHLNQYNKSKLVIKDQWASHPSLEERVSRLEATGFISPTTSPDLANVLFTNLTGLQVTMTRRMFEQVSDMETPIVWSTKELVDYYQAQVESNALPGIFNGYYNDHAPLFLPENPLINVPSDQTLEQLFSDEKVDLIDTVLSLKTDITVLRQLTIEHAAIKSFDYDGVKYKTQFAQALVEKLQMELTGLQAQVQKQEAMIYSYFLNAERHQNRTPQLEKKYRSFYLFNELYQNRMDLHASLSKSLEFVNYDTAFDTITAHFKNLAAQETRFKQAIQDLINTKLFGSALTLEMFLNFNNYTTQNLSYFNGANYNEEHLTILYTAMNDFHTLFSNKHIELKRTLLAYMESLVHRA